MALTAENIQYLDSVVVAIIEGQTAPMSSSNVWWEFENRLIPGMLAWENTVPAKLGMPINDVYGFRSQENLNRLLEEGRIMKVVAELPGKCFVLYFPKTTWFDISPKTI